MSKISKLNELNELVRAEKVRIATETVAELRAGTFDITADEAVQALKIAQEQVDYEAYYNEECRSEAQYSWEGLWTRADDLRLNALYEDLDLIKEGLKKANEAFDAKIPF